MKPNTFYLNFQSDIQTAVFRSIEQKFRIHPCVQSVSAKLYHTLINTSGIDISLPNINLDTSNTRNTRNSFNIGNIVSNKFLNFKFN